MSMLATDFVFEADGVEICIMFDPAVSPNWAQIIETESGEVPDRLGNNNIVDTGKKACLKASPNNEHLHVAVHLMGGVIATAGHFGISRSAVYQWLEKGIPANRVLNMVKAIDYQVSAKDLRPDIFSINPIFNQRSAIKKYIKDKFKVTEVREIRVPISVRHELEGPIEEHK